MISIVVGTNREGSKSANIAGLIKMMLDKEGRDSKILSMSQVPQDILSNQMFGANGQHHEIAELQDKYITPANKFIFIIPEYNGSFPGVLKLFIDAISVRNYKSNFRDKKGLIVGVASGRLGNAIGASHLNSILNYMGMHTYPEKIYIAGVDGKFKDDIFVDENDIKILTQLISDFNNY